MNHTVKSLNLSIEEIGSLLSIDDPDQRREVFEALTRCAESPDDAQPRDYTGKHPMTLCLVEKVRRKSEAARRRRQAREKAKSLDDSRKKISDAADIASKTSDQLASVPEAVLELNQTVIAKILWLRRNHSQWMRAFFGLFRLLDLQSIPASLAAEVRRAVDSLFAYLKPLLPMASRYYSLPSGVRPRFVKL